MNTHSRVKAMAMAAKAAAATVAKSTLQQRNGVLTTLMEKLDKNRAAIMHANQLDMALAEAGGLNKALLERLSLENRLSGIIEEIQQVVNLPDPLGELREETTLPNGLNLVKWSTSLGVIGVIYESRPNVTLDISALTIKSGNCTLLRGGSETVHTNQVLVELIQQSLEAWQLPKEVVQALAIEPSQRAEVAELLQLHQYVDLIIPRGGMALQQFCREQSKIPVITGGVGICHLYVDESADLERSLTVILNAKTERCTVCNALNTLLVHTALAPAFIPLVVNRLEKQAVSFRLDPGAWELLEHPACQRAAPADWDTEWLSLVLGIKVVADLDAAIAHIQRHGTAHSDGILTENAHHADRFTREVDSAAVYVNASTRFTDGGQFGMGGEVAVSTQKLHARGPMGLKELTSYKWVVRGNYQTRM
jgi:glutamate-5-semialdehyde dehydrogenase